MNKFRDGIEPKAKQNEFKPTPKAVMDQTIGRDASPFKQLKQPEFEDAIVTTHTPHIAFMHSVVKAEFRRF